MDITESERRKTTELKFHGLDATDVDLTGFITASIQPFYQTL